MSSALAIAGVSAVLRDLLNNGLIDQAATDKLGVTITVSVGPPDRVIPAAGGTETTRLNLFMYNVTSNTGWRNEGLPSRDSSGTQRLSNPPLAINLHYLISAHASEDLHGEILLGYAMQFLHETPVLSRNAIQKALSPSSPPLVSDKVPPALPTLTTAMKALQDSGLENQIEQIKITPEYLNTEELSKLWTATQSHLRPTAAYMASVVLIEAKNAVKTSLPVLRRGDQDQGVDVQVGAGPILQTVSAGLPDEANRKPAPPSWPSAQLGLRLTFHGEQLSGEQVSLRFNHQLLPPQEISVPQADRNGKEISINLTIPTDPTAQIAWVAGIYTVTALVVNNGRTRYSNTLPLLLAPYIKNIPNSVPSVGGNATFDVQCSPNLPIEATKAGPLWKLALKQKVSLRLAGMELEPQALADSSAAIPPASTDSLTFVFKNAPPVSGEIARLRVDGVDSLPFKRRDLPAPPRLVFDDNQKVTIT